MLIWVVCGYARGYRGGGGGGASPALLGHSGCVRIVSWTPAGVVARSADMRRNEVSSCWGEWDCERHAERVICEAWRSGVVLVSSSFSLDNIVLSWFPSLWDCVGICQMEICTNLVNSSKCHGEMTYHLIFYFLMQIQIFLSEISFFHRLNNSVYNLRELLNKYLRWSWSRA